MKKYWSILSKSNVSNTKKNFIKKFLIEKLTCLIFILKKENKINYQNFLHKMKLKKIIDITENLKHKTIITTIYSCGLRLSELLELKISDIKIRTRLYCY